MNATAPTDDLAALEKCECIEKKLALEHSLATNFAALQKTNVPTERQRIWGECLRLAGELEKLDVNNVNPYAPTNI